MSENAAATAAKFRNSAILPRDSLTGRALVAIVAIMTFLAALTIGAVRIASISAKGWRADLAREMTIQIKPVEGRDLEADVQKALMAVQKVSSVTEAHAYDKEESEKLLEPWLGAGFDLKSLPVPRLIRLKLSGDTPATPEALRYAVTAAVPNAVLDDHRNFAARLSTISTTVMLIGAAILGLVIAATMLSVSFATRGAVAGNRPTVEVLHLVGARDSFIAGIFQRHFLEIGLKGGLIGAAAAAVLFALWRFAARAFGMFSADSDAAFLTGSFSLDARGYLEIAAAALFIALFTAVSSRLTVYATLRNID